jgi:hypothetical protein
MKTVAVILVVAFVLPPLAILLAGLLKREREDTRLKAQLTLSGVIFAVAMAALAFQSLSKTGLQQTSALFVGIPVVLAIACVFAPAGQSSVGIAVKAVTIGLLTSLIFLGEGMLCVAISAPLFYAVAIMMAKIYDEMNSDDGHGRGRTRIFPLLGMMALAPFSLEGVLPATTVDRHATVSETRVIDASAAEIEAALLAPPRFDRQLPFYLGIGFPRPTATRIDGATWSITMRGGEMRLNGTEPRSGTLVLAVDDRGPGFINWRAISDDSHMRHYMSWRSSRVEWEAIDAGRTRVTWTIRYSRDLDPAWYFGPMERYAVRLAAGYLIDSVATP